MGGWAGAWEDGAGEGKGGTVGIGVGRAQDRVASGFAGNMYTRRARSSPNGRKGFVSFLLLSERAGEVGGVVDVDGWGRA